MKNSSFKQVFFGLLAVALLTTGGCTQLEKTSNKNSVDGAGPYQCYAKAMPTRGHGGSGWGPTIGQARTDAMNNCYKYAGQTGGTPQTCKIVEARCN